MIPSIRALSLVVAAIIASPLAADELRAWNEEHIQSVETSAGPETLASSSSARQVR